MSALIRLFDDYFLSERPVGGSIADIDLDLKPQTSINRLKKYKWSRNDILHYSALTFFLTLAFFINPASLLFKIPLLALFIFALLVPLTSQFFLNALPILTWVFFFFSSNHIPKDYRPPISVKVLPAMETILYGDNLSQLSATTTTSFLDLLSWLPYGMIHFSLPFVVAVLLFLWGPPTSLRSFAFAFGYMNLIGVVIQLVFPAAPPWYKILHGLDPANYSMLGSPGGLERIDTLLGLDLYTTNFSKNSPLVFGAFPSLHSGSATMDALFLTYLFPRGKLLFFVYVLWLWWATMYLTHHYFIDVIAGSFLSLCVFQYVKYRHLPLNDLRSKNRWSYIEIKKPNMFKLDPLQFSTEVDAENPVVNPVQEQVLTRARSRSIRQNAIELNVVSRQSRMNSTMSLPTIPSPVDDETISQIGAEDSDSSPELSVFDSDVPRSLSRSSITSVGSSQYDLSLPQVSTAGSGPSTGKARKD